MLYDGVLAVNKTYTQYNSTSVNEKKAVEAYVPGFMSKAYICVCTFVIFTGH